MVAKIRRKLQDTHRLKSPEWISFESPRSLLARNNGAKILKKAVKNAIFTHTSFYPVGIIALMALVIKPFWLRKIVGNFANRVSIADQAYRTGQ